MPPPDPGPLPLLASLPVPPLRPTIGDWTFISTLCSASLGISIVGSTGSCGGWTTGGCVMGIPTSLGGTTLKYRTPPVPPVPAPPPPACPAPPAPTPSPL